MAYGCSFNLKNLYLALKFQVLSKSRLKLMHDLKEFTLTSDFMYTRLGHRRSTLQYMAFCSSQSHVG